jgi:hypothetical protein
MASLVVLKNSTFSTLGFRAVHVGLQKIPVVFTAAINIPSYEASLATRALYIMASVSILFFYSKIT